MSDLSREARALIEAARPAERPAASAKGRIRAALAAQLSLPPGHLPHAHASPPASVAVTGAGIGAGTKLLLLCALTTAVVGGAAGVRHWASPRAPEARRPSQTPVPSSTPLPVALADAVTPVPDDSSKQHPSVARATPGPSRKTQAAVEHTFAARRHRLASAPLASVADSRATEMNAVAGPPSRPTTVAPTTVAPTMVAPPMAAPPMVAPPMVAPPMVASERGSATGEVASLPANRAVESAPLSLPARHPKTGCSARQELRLLAAAQIALRERRAKAALAMLDRHTVLCPSPRFREEHSTAHILALCLLNQRERAQAEAGELATLAPTSPQLARLRTTCAAPGLEKARDPDTR